MDLNSMHLREDKNLLYYNESGFNLKDSDLEGENDFEKLAVKKICSDIIKKLFGLLTPPDSQLHLLCDKEIQNSKNLDSYDSIKELLKLSEDFITSPESRFPSINSTNTEVIEYGKVGDIISNETLPKIGNLIRVDLLSYRSSKHLFITETEFSENQKESKLDGKSNQDCNNKTIEDYILKDPKNNQIQDLNMAYKINNLASCQEYAPEIKKFEIIDLKNPRPSLLELNQIEAFELLPKFRKDSHLLVLSKNQPCESIFAEYKQSIGLLSICRDHHLQIFSLFTKQPIGLLEITKKSNHQVHSVKPKININILEIEEESIQDSKLEIKDIDQNINRSLPQFDPCNEKIDLSSAEIQAGLVDKVKNESQLSDTFVKTSNIVSGLPQSIDSKASSLILSSESVHLQSSTKIINSVYSSDSNLSSSSSLVQSNNSESVSNLANTSQVLQDSIANSDFFLLSNSTIKPNPLSQVPDIDPESLQCQLVESETEDEFELI